MIILTTFNWSDSGQSRNLHLNLPPLHMRGKNGSLFVHHFVKPAELKGFQRGWIWVFLDELQMNWTRLEGWTWTYLDQKIEN